MRGAKPFALAEQTVRGLRVVAANDMAAQLGVVKDLPVTDARARTPHLIVRPVDREGDARALHALALWATRRFTPSAALDGTDGLILDVEGCAHLFGGERGLTEAVDAALSRLGLAARIGLADGRQAAWAAARFLEDAPALIPSGAARQMLGPAPLAALGLPTDTAADLRRIGLKTIDDLSALPRAGLALRFGPGLDDALRRLDALMGRAPVRPQRYVQEPTRFRAAQAFPEPLLDPAQLGMGFARLAQALADKLIRAERGARRLVFTAERADGSQAQIEAALARPSVDPDHMIRLFAERLGTIDPGFGVDRLVLAAPAAEPLRARQTTLAPQSGETEVFARLVDRLSARFGRDAVRRPVPYPSHIPERAQTMAAGCAAAPAWPAFDPDAARRPIALFDPPEPVEVSPETPPQRFVWRRVVRETAKVRGPERVAPEWWRDPAADPQADLRDYYEVEDLDGRRYWLFRRDGPTAGWFVHGLFP